jgi:hypothetical protein
MRDFLIIAITIAAAAEVFGTPYLLKDIPIARYHSARGPNADRRANPLNCQRKEGSNSEADSHSDTFSAISLNASRLAES